MALFYCIDSVIVLTAFKYTLALALFWQCTKFQENLPDDLKIYVTNERTPAFEEEQTNDQDLDVMALLENTQNIIASLTKSLATSHEFTIPGEAAGPSGGAAGPTVS